MYAGSGIHTVHRIVNQRIQVAKRNAYTKTVVRQACENKLNDPETIPVVPPCPALAPDRPPVCLESIRTMPCVCCAYRRMVVYEVRPSGSSLACNLAKLRACVRTVSTLSGKQ